MENPTRSEKPSSFKRIWKDPVWASVIASIIFACITFIVAQTNNAFGAEEDETQNHLTCTATGPNTNVRSGQGINLPVVFQVSKGEYFQVIGNGHTDVVHDKSGRWKRISYEGKEGWMFSAYMTCN